MCDFFKTTIQTFSTIERIFVFVLLWVNVMLAFLITMQSFQTLRIFPHGAFHSNRGAPQPGDLGIGAGSQGQDPGPHCETSADAEVASQRGATGLRMTLALACMTALRAE